MRDDFESCICSGGVAVFPSDTVYGLACDAENPDAVACLNALKGRSPDKPAAVMFFDAGRLPPMPPRTAALARRLLPGPVTLVIGNPDGRFPLACGEDPGTLGVRVPAASPLAGAGVAVLQTSANHAGGADPRSVAEVPAELRRDAALVLDAGPLPGTPSTVLDLRAYEQRGEWSVLRAGALAIEAIARAIAE